VVSELPSGTVTFLFTDIEGSTRLWEEHGDAMQPALARHDALLRDAVVAHAGNVVKTTGDGIHAVFATAHDALDAAVAMQLGLGEEPFAETGPLRVRIGVHTCEAQYRDGDYYGSEVNRAARLMSIAYGGQVVISAVTRSLVRDGSVELADLGEHRLRDLSMPERVFEVRAPGLSSGFPPLRSLDAFPGNLPRQLTSFVGRHQELAGMAKALEEWRLVTVTGTGGVGKTRLAVQVAAETLPRFGDGAWWCELAAASDGETMAQVVAAELGVSQRAGMSLPASVSEYLRPKELLLVLDNCEHLLDPVSAFAEQVLRECPGVRILATSREGLAVEGERVWPLRSLPLPDASGAEIVTNDAVRLFVERAEAARAGFGADAANVGAVGEICRRLDGIPLAIELAAARVVSMSPREISGLLDERFRLLTGGRRSAVERHQTLRATVDWSYSLLAERERAVFDRLGVFAGSFDAKAAQVVAVGDGVEAWDVLDALTELVAKSMVLADVTADGTTRYQMLETLRQYARERIDERGDADQWRRRHGGYFAVWAEEAGPALEGSDELAWRVRETAELDNLRAAVTWALDRDDPDDVALALRIVSALADDSMWQPALGVGAWADAALAHLGNATPRVRYAVTAAAACYEFNLGNYGYAEELAVRAIGDGVPEGATGPGLGHLALAFAASLLGDVPRAIALELDAARMLDRDFPASPWRVFSHAMAGQSASLWGVPVARAEAEVALHQARELANPSALAAALCSYGLVLADEDPDGALAAFDECIALGRRGASASMFSQALNYAAGVRARTGDLPRAARDLREGIERSQRLGSRAAVYLGVWSGVEVLTALERWAEAGVFDGVASTGIPVESRTGTPLAVVPHARASYGPERYDEAVRTGAAMTYDEAVEYALAVLDEIIDMTQSTDA
jgi:predicted ATPase/class 3 adenylate cyclase